MDVCPTLRSDIDRSTELPQDKHDALWQQIVEVVRATLLADWYVLSASPYANAKPFAPAPPCLT